MRASVLACQLALALVSGVARAQEGRLLDPFQDAGAWEAYASEGIAIALAADGGALRADIDYRGGAGYAVLRRPLGVTLGDNYVFSFRLRGTLPPNTLEFKLLDSTGQNVWWAVRRNRSIPRAWETITVRRREISFAWGPAGGGELRRPAALEIAFTAGEGGAGSVWIDSLLLTDLPPVDTTWPVLPRAVSGDAGRTPHHAMDGDSATAWTLPVGAATLDIDLGALREFSGVVLRWTRGRRAVSVDVSRDGRTWRAAGRSPPGDGAVAWLPAGELEATRLRLRVEPGTSAALGEVELLPVAWAARPNELAAAVAARARRGDMPQAFGGPVTWWTVVGDTAAFEEALFDEFGRIEVGERRFSIEPMLEAGDRLWTWADATTHIGMASGALPLPWARLQFARFTLQVEAWPQPAERGAALGARYRLVNLADSAVAGHLLLALRPLQVNPPTQFLNIEGGVGRITHVAATPSGVSLDGRGVGVVGSPVTRMATTFAASGLTGILAAGDAMRDSVHDSLGLASAALRVPFRLGPGASTDVLLAVALDSGAALPQATASLLAGRAGAHRASAGMLPDLELEGPAEVRELAGVLRHSAGYILVNRDSAAIQPGSRAYARSWIRDGALTSSALLRLGLHQPARDFLEWFAPFLFDSGKVPCCVDRRGGDPVPENDSHGEFIYLAAEHARVTGERDLLRALWPAIERAASYMDSLRHLRMTPAYARDTARAYWGLLPESISHEGYSARPVHSYWDQFWALRGFRDAAAAARMLGHPDSTRWDRVADEFQRDLLASIGRTMDRHGITYVPGSVELGDFDATSTTIAGDPVGVLDLLPRAAVERTFEMLDSILDARRRGVPWDAYTPYEARNVGAKVRLGWRASALAELRDLMADRRPVEWDQWPEVIFREPRQRTFLGDLPHTWVASDVIRSVLDLFAYREDDDTIIVLAGVPREWLAGAGVRVRLPWGSAGELAYAAREEAGVLVTSITSVPNGVRLVWRPPDGVTAPR